MLFRSPGELGARELGARELGARDDGPGSDSSDTSTAERQLDIDGGGSGHVPQPHAPRRDDHAQRKNGQAERPRIERIWDVPSASQHRAESTPIAAAPAISAGPVHEDKPASPTPPLAVDTPPSRRRHEADSSEARIERVVVRPDQAVNPEGDAASQPQRKGWWQRRFGGD